MSIDISLNGNWKLTWKALEGCDDVPECNSEIVGIVPGDVHEDLVRAELLPEPLVGANAPLHEWVEKALFLYERDFTIQDEFTRAEIIFEGLDCLAEIYIDNEMIGSTANGFVPHTLDITNFLKIGKRHTLRVEIETGVQWGKRQDHSKYQCNENCERIFLRKAQFSFKWDWAPRLVTCGIWRDVTLKLYDDAAIRDVMINPDFHGKNVTVNATVNIEAFEDGEYDITLAAKHENKETTESIKTPLSRGINSVALKMDIENVERWYPKGYGKPALYDITAIVKKSDKIADEWKTRYGFREILLKREPIGDGEETFIINVNGIDIFCKGANWVPADSIFARVSDEKYKALISEAIEANFNMFRIWGGGIYEDKKFYNLCDERGIMIWHDFMFACAEYPDDCEWFVDNVREEASKVVKMLRDHPSIVLWCGNNENDWIHGYYGRGKDGKMQPFYGLKLYSEVLPSICAALDPNRPYWQSSPFGGDDPNCEALGDRHAWNVSILAKDVNERADIRNYAKEHGKFNSEYGVISYALPKTILEYTQNEKIDFNSPEYKVHDNPFNSEVNLTDEYLKVGFGEVPKDELTYIWQSLAYQAMGYREAISDFRIQKFNCAGSIFWMYSDCWGTLGWTIVDYYLRRKPSFYWVRKAYAPLAVFVRIEGNVAKSYIVNDTLSDIPVTLFLEVAYIKKGKGEGVSEDIFVAANDVVKGPELECSKGYAYARIERDENVLSEDLILTHFPSEMEIPKVRLTCDVKKNGDVLTVSVSSSGFGHFVFLDVPDSAVVSDNYFNLLPSRPKVIKVKGCKKEDIKVRALNQVSKLK